MVQINNIEMAISKNLYTHQAHIFCNNLGLRRHSLRRHIKKIYRVLCHAPTSLVVVAMPPISPNDERKELTKSNIASPHNIRERIKRCSFRLAKPEKAEFTVRK